MSDSVRESIYDAIAAIRLVDPHTHINPHNPASQTLADILGYHYYTELVHSAGMPKELIEEPDVSPRELVQRLVRGLPNIENTANYQWLINICRTFFDFEDDRITESNWETLYDTAESKMSSAQWPQMVLDQSNVEAVFLTNDFDDDLEGFDANTYIPCLRTDDLVFHLGKFETRERLAACSGIELDGSLASLRASLRQRFEHFVPAGARACAISIPPNFEPGRVADGRAETALNEVLRKGNQADESHRVALSRRVFWTLAELCDEFGVPFDLMIGVNRGVYPDGVYQGQDLYDSRVSLIQYRELFNAFPDVKFPISVLASVTNQELVSYAWIFPNVITNGHWWYSNTPSFIKRDAAARLEAVPKNKQIGYYSDAYKLEFVWAKFDMYRQILSGILADYFVGDCGWSEERAIELGHQVLRGNVDAIFPSQIESVDDVYDDVEVVADDADSLASESLGAIAGAVLLAAGAIGMVEVSEPADEIEEEEEVEEDDGELLYDDGQDDEADDEQADVVDEAEDEEFEDEEFADEEFADEEYEDVEDELDEEASDEEYEDVDDEEEAGDEEYEDVDDEEEAGDEEYEDVDDEEEAGDEEYEDVIEADGGELDDGESELPELGTVVDINDTIRIESDEVEGEFELDPTPTEDEIQAVDVADVELRDLSAEAVDAGESIDLHAEVEPLNVGNLLSNEDDDSDELAETNSDSSEIRMLRGDSGFVPDEESLQLSKDPLTGELTFAAPHEDDDDADVPPSLQDTVDLDDYGRVVDGDENEEDVDDDQ